MMDPKKMPFQKPPLSAADCYRFAMEHPAVEVCLCSPKDGDQMKDPQGIGKGTA